MVTSGSTTTHDTGAVFLQPDNHNKKYEALFVEIDTGQIKLPKFQREFVWAKEQSAKLIDSILKGFPIGTFIFWKTRDELRSYKDIGNHTLPTTPKNDYVQYVLDGQQRITSLYAIRKGIRIDKDGETIDYKDIYINLDYDAKLDEQIAVTEKVEGKKYVSVHRILANQITDFFDDFPDRDDLRKIGTYKSSLTGYDFSSITIKDYPIEIACEVFSRINTGGKDLTIFEIMVAKTYDEKKKFDLAEQYELLRDGADDTQQCLTFAKFETIPASIIMQCVSAITQRGVRSRDILKIRRETFIENWEPMKAALFTAVDFIRTELRVPVSQLLPYPAILIPLTYLFSKAPRRKLSHDRVVLLEQFFYWVGLTQRYSSATESKITEDFNKMDAILDGNAPPYTPSDLTVSSEVIRETWFSPTNAYCKIILCLLADRQPLTVDTGGSVILDNSNLKIASSRNYHHFFPKSYLGKHPSNYDANLIANITLIDAHSNKYGIGSKAPATYIKRFSEENPNLNKALKSHFIFDIEKFGINTNDYEAFIEKRSDAITAALNKKLAGASRGT